jgi:hypothetical protein
MAGTRITSGAAGRIAIQPLRGDQIRVAAAAERGPRAAARRDADTQGAWRRLEPDGSGEVDRGQGSYRSEHAGQRLPKHEGRGRTAMTNAHCRRRRRLNASKGAGSECANDRFVTRCDDAQSALERQCATAPDATRPRAGGRACPAPRRCGAGAGSVSACEGTARGRVDRCWQFALGRLRSRRTAISGAEFKLLRVFSRCACREPSGGGRRRPGTPGRQKNGGGASDGCAGSSGSV